MMLQDLGKPMLEQRPRHPRPLARTRGVPSQAYAYRMRINCAMTD